MELQTDDGKRELQADHSYDRRGCLPARLESLFRAYLAMIVHAVILEVARVATTACVLRRR